MPAMASTGPDSRASSDALRARLSGLCDALFDYAHARAPQRSQALDAVQETLAAALIASAKGKAWADPDDGNDALWAWLISVLRNKLADVWRREGRAQEDCRAARPEKRAVRETPPGEQTGDTLMEDERGRRFRDPIEDRWNGNHPHPA